MQTSHYDVYAQLLLACKEVMGTVDLEKLTNDEQYKIDFFKSAKLNPDDMLIEMAGLVKRELTSEH
ncbi:MAG: hypothetical protein V3U89_02855 [Methylophilaceae bacterium]